MKIKIKEQSMFARVAAYKLKCTTVAAVFGTTIHLWNITRGDFLKRKPWVMHEIVHVQQFKRYGFLRFAFLYVIENIKKGYQNNRFEIEAREIEETVQPNLSGFDFI